jgi:hypothetical protein
MNWVKCECNVGPGKFEGEDALAYLAWQSALNGCVDASTGPEGAVTDWFRRPFNFDADESVIQVARDYGYCEECIKEALESEAGGLALFEDSWGFVYCEEYATVEEFDRALKQAESEDADCQEDE